MSIDQWLTAHQFKAKQLAQMLGCSEATLSSWRAGRFRPSNRMMVRLVRFTRGEIRPSDFTLTKPPSG